MTNSCQNILPILSVFLSLWLKLGWLTFEWHATINWHWWFTVFFLLDQNNHANGLELSALSITLTTVESHTIYFTFSWNFLMWFFSMNVVLIFFSRKANNWTPCSTDESVCWNDFLDALASLNFKQQEETHMGPKDNFWSTKMSKDSVLAKWLDLGRHFWICKF